MKEDATQTRERARDRLSKLASFFANYLDGSPSQPPLSVPVCFRGKLSALVQRQSPLSKAFSPSYRWLSLLGSVRFYSFLMSYARFHRIVGAGGPRANAAENQRAPEEERKAGKRETERTERKKNKEQRKKDKAERAKRSGGISQDGWFFGVGRERASCRRLTERDVCL